MNGSVIDIVVDDLVGITIPAMVGSFLPELRSIEIGRSDAEQCQRGDGEGQLQAKEIEYRLRRAPLTWDGLVAGFESHGGGRAAIFPFPPNVYDNTTLKLKPFDAHGNRLGSSSATMRYLTTLYEGLNNEKVAMVLKIE